MERTWHDREPCPIRPLASQATGLPARLSLSRGRMLQTRDCLRSLPVPLGFALSAWATRHLNAVFDGRELTGDTPLRSTRSALGPWRDSKAAGIDLDSRYCAALALRLKAPWGGRRELVRTRWRQPLVPHEPLRRLMAREYQGRNRHPRRQGTAFTFPWSGPASRPTERLPRYRTARQLVEAQGTDVYRPPVCRTYSVMIDSYHEGTSRDASQGHRPQR